MWADWVLGGITGSGQGQRGREGGAQKTELNSILNLKHYTLTSHLSFSNPPYKPIG